MNFFNSIITTYYNAEESLNEAVNPQLNTWKDNRKGEIAVGQLASTVSLIAGVTFGIIGLAFAFSGSAKAIPLIFVAVPLVYLGYNSYQVLENCKDVVEKITTKYRKVNGELKIKEPTDQLKTNTIFAGWFIDLLALELSKIKR